MAEVGHQLIWMGWQSVWIVGAFACVIFILHQKIQKMLTKDTTFGYHPMYAPTCLCKQEVEKSSQNAVQPCVKVKRYVNEDLRAGGLRKGWGFGVGTWNTYIHTHIDTFIMRSMVKLHARIGGAGCC